MDILFNNGTASTTYLLLLKNGEKIHFKESHVKNVLLHILLHIFTV